MTRQWHIAMAALSFAPLALNAAEPQTTTTLQLRSDGPSLSPEEAKRLTPQALGEALLAPGHLAVTEAVIGPQGMEPPPPPGEALPTRVKLYLKPFLSNQSGFCERTVATTYLQSIGRLGHSISSRGHPVDLETVEAYRWIGELGEASDCIAPRYAFFIPKLEDRQHALEAVRLLATASQAAKTGRRLSFPLSIEDKEGPTMLAYQRNHPNEAPIPAWQIITDAKKALASLPINEVTFAGPSETAIPNVLLASDLTNSKNDSARAVTIFLGGDWTVGIVIADGRIVRMRLERAIPAPF